jgi:hypothetical protein
MLFRAESDDRRLLREEILEWKHACVCRPLQVALALSENSRKSNKTPLAWVSRERHGMCPLKISTVGDRA